MTKKKTNTEFKQQLYDIFNDEYTLVGTYTDSNTKVAIRHNVCGTINYVFPSNALRGAKCKKCSDIAKGKKQAKGLDKFKQQVHDLVKDDYTVLGEYTNSNTKILIKHNNCGHEYKVTPDSFLHGSRCPQCNGGIRKTNQVFLKEVYNLVSNEYIFLEEYQSNKAKIKVKHNVCNRVYMVTPDSFLHGRRCPYCYGNIRKTTQQFKNEVYNLVGDEYQVLSSYKNNKTKVIFKHKKCNQEFGMTPTDFINRGHRCIHCFQHGSSHGNHWIAKALDELNIKYNREYKFKDCKDKRELPFDFYLPTLNVCIEYDGIQHFDTNSMYYDKNQVKHDLIKTKYCLDNQIKLLRLRYDDYDTYEKIKNYLTTSIAGIEAQNRVQTQYL